MTTRFPTLAALAALAAFAACGGNGDAAPKDEMSAATAAATPGSADKQLADIGAYRLTMEKIDRFMEAQRSYMRKANAMTPAEREAETARNEAMGDSNGTIDEMVRNVERQPVLLAALREAGLSAREYTLIMMSMMQTAMASGVAQMRPNDNQDSLIRAMQANPDNVQFYRANEAAITRKTKEMQDEMKRLIPEPDVP